MEDEAPVRVERHEVRGHVDGVSTEGGWSRECLASFSTILTSWCAYLCDTVYTYRHTKQIRNKSVSKRPALGSSATRAPSRCQGLATSCVAPSLFMFAPFFPFWRSIVAVTRKRRCTVCANGHNCEEETRDRL